MRAGWGVIFLMAVSMTACGVTESASTAASVAAAEARQAEQARQQEAQIRKQLDAANSQAAERLRQADEDSK